MKNGLFTIDWVNVKSAIVYGLLTMALAFILAVAEGVLKEGSIFGIDWSMVIDRGVLVSLGVFVSMVSIIKNLLTTKRGDFLGTMKVSEGKY
jgi:hypothetical protein